MSHVNHEGVSEFDPDFNLSLKWQTVQQAITCHPEHEWESLFIIDNFLAYLPTPEIYLPHLPFLNALCASHQRGELTEAQLILELEFHCKRIRNDDMKKYGWAVNRRYEQADYDYYETHLGIYKQKARDRLSKLIGAEPPLEYSLGAEVYMRQVFLSDDFHDSQPYSIFEDRAVTITSYREALLNHGLKAADESILWGQYICQCISISPYTRHKINY